MAESSTRVDVISIGTLARNRLWNEATPVRTAHSTTTLIRTGKRSIIVDPGLPAQALGARLHERTGLRPEQVDTVFLTNFRPYTRAGLQLFAKARVLIHEVEQQSTAAQIEGLLRQAPEQDIDRGILEQELEMVQSFKPAEDKLAAGVDLFPLFGFTPGTCGLLISAPTLTTLITGDAVPTKEHFLAGQVLPDAQDIRQAQESLQEVYEIADLIIPGHDNLFPNPRAMGL